MRLGTPVAAVVTYVLAFIQTLDGTVAVGGRIEEELQASIAAAVLVAPSSRKRRSKK